jgi:hypothetical protein
VHEHRHRGGCGQHEANSKGEDWLKMGPNVADGGVEGGAVEQRRQEQQEGEVRREHDVGYLG